jgi:hypothetical protein
MGSLLIILISFFVFLFILYYLSKDDFVIIRKDLALDRIFSMAILMSVFSLIFSRFCFAIFNFKTEFINPLVFFAIPYHPGFSLIGAVVGGALFVYFYSFFKNIPIVGRLFDLFTMAFIGVFPIGFLFYIFLMQGKETMLQNIIFIASVIILFVFTKILFPFSSKGEIKDGSLGLIFILILSFVYFTGGLFLDAKNFSFLGLENVFVLITFFASLILIINQEIMNKYLGKK